jgi:hypothetical protein
MPGATYATKDGTSMAAPHVTGVAALAMAQVPSATNLVIRDLILYSVDPIASLAGMVVTGGRLNAFKTLTNAVAVEGAGAPRDGLRLAGRNPARREASFDLSLARRGPVEVAIFDVSGRRVRTLAAGALDPGVHRLTWDRHDEHGLAAAAGVYFARARTEGGTFGLRIALLR